MKRISKSLIALLLIALLIPSPMQADAAGSTYVDTGGHWAEVAIERWSELGVLKGSDGRFRPDDSISRAELAAIINRIMKFPASDVGFFSDTAGKWYEADVNALALQEIYLVSSGQALGEQPLNREEAVEMLYRAFAAGRIPSLKNTPPEFTDQKDVSAEYATAVSLFRKLGFINGYADGSFHPKDLFTRAQVVTILNNIIGLYITEPGEYDVPEGANVCIAVPGVTVSGDKIHYISVLPAACEGKTVLEWPPEFGIHWGTEKSWSWSVLSIKKTTASTLVYRSIQSAAIDTVFAGGTGRESDPFIIENEAQLRHLDKYLSESYKSTYFKLGNDIGLSSEWTPIGTDVDVYSDNNTTENVFCGILDGGGHTISNLNISYKGNERRLFGLFSHLNGTVKNLTVSGSVNVEWVSSGQGQEAPDIAVGAIAGIVGRRGGVSALIENCHTEVTIEAKGPAGVFAGGIVGEIEAGGRVKDSSSTGQISVYSGGVLARQNADAGGIAGAMGTGLGQASILNTYSDANVTASGGYYSHAGGIIGIAGRQSRIESCFASGAVHAKDSKYQNNAGGIAGQLENRTTGIYTCAAAADITAAGNPIYFNAAGGLAGSAYTESSISESYSAGTVTVDGYAAVGGIVGRAECKIRICYTVTKINAPESASDIAFNGLVGPIRGSIIVTGCGVFNVSEPHFISFDEKSDELEIKYVEGRTLHDLDTYSELGGTSWNKSTWAFASSGSYQYPILVGIPESLQADNG